MTKKKEKGFTLIELIGVLVIMAIIALIVTLLVMNIIRKARVAADKRSIDAYGRSIELAIAGYLLDTGKFPTSVEQLTIEYSGNQVVCSTTQINPDSSVYLSDCKVNNREVSNYSYGSDKTPKIYNVGDIVTYNDIDFYVIKYSGSKDDSVTLLKAEPLTVDEVNLYGVGHVNSYLNYPVYRGGDKSNQVYNINDYGGIAYYNSNKCGYVDGDSVYTECFNEYEKSDIKYVIDAWKIANAPAAIEARLITLSDLINNLGYVLEDNPTSYIALPVDTPSWVYNENYSYWTSSLYNDSNEVVLFIKDDGGVYETSVINPYQVVRPVIVLDKSELN